MFKILRGSVHLECMYQQFNFKLTIFLPYSRGFNKTSSRFFFFFVAVDRKIRRHMFVSGKGNWYTRMYNGQAVGGALAEWI